MATIETSTARATHAVENQPPPLAEYNLYEQDSALKAAIEREGASWAEDRLMRLGAEVGGRPLELGRLANTFLPELKTHDRFGNRIDEVEYHPAWHELLKLGVEREVHALPWLSAEPGSHVARAGLFILLGQAESGIMCPISMTYAGIPALAASPELTAEWRPRFTLPDYENGALCGMALTEKQGGSDVGANSTVARPVGGDTYELTGHKWFCSHPVCDGFLVTARIEGASPGSRGISCFFMPRFLPDGSRNRIYIQRLKDKLGTRSLASGEVEYDGAIATLVGEEGRGIPTVLPMISHTRLDCTLGSAAAMRRAVAEATHHAAYRAAFGKQLIDQPLMQNVLADLCVEYEAAVAAALRLARAFDAVDSGGAREDDAEARFQRLATPIVKYHACKRAPAVAVEALECLGGNGYVEESAMPQIYRDSQVNSTWEGSGNVIALDVLRALVKEPETLPAFLDELDTARGADSRLDRAIDEVKAAFDPVAGETEVAPTEYTARTLVDRMALTLQGVLLVRAAERDPGIQPVAEAFVATRLDESRGQQLGTLPAGIDCEAIIERNRPQL